MLVLLCTLSCTITCPCTLILARKHITLPLPHSLTPSLPHSLTYLFSHSLAHSLAHLCTRTHTHSRLHSLAHALAHSWQTLPSSVWCTELFELTARCVLQPNSVGFDMSDIEIVNQLPEEVRVECLFVCLFVCLCVCIFVCLCVCMFCLALFYFTIGADFICLLTGRIATVSTK